MKKLTIYCGANKGASPIFEQETARFGRILTEKGIEIIYGGGSVGLMGVLADAAMDAGGKVTGVITTYLNEQREVGHRGISEMIVLPTMSIRKTKLLALGEGCVTLPGGYGSMDELFEALTLAQLHEYPYPIGLLNIAGFYDPMLKMLDSMVENGFVKAQNLDFLVVDDDPERLLERMKNYVYEPVTKW